MTAILINQAVDVHWHLPSAQIDGTILGDEVTRTFDNLVPACEFAVAMAKEGNLLVQLYPDIGPVLDISQAEKIAADWETGKIPVDAKDIEI
jgi:hypothetical protein